MRVISAANGTVRRLPLTLNGRDLVLEDARGLALVQEGADTWLYLAEHDAGTLLRTKLPGGACEVVLKDLNRPSALAPAPGGGLLVADRDRLQRYRPGQPPTLVAGSAAATRLEGDARLAGFPETTAIQPDTATGDVVLTDYSALVVRRLR